MDLQTISNQESQIANTARQKKLTGEMGKDEFLKLLVAQLGHQDPLNPMDNTAFISQLAQFSTLEQSFQTNKQLEQLAELQTSQLLGQSWNMIGKKVTAVSDAMSIDKAGVAPPLQFDLDSKANEVSMNIYDASNKLVRTVNLGSSSGGINSVPWDGKDSSGVLLPIGNYRLELQAKDAAGQSVSGTTRLSGVVTGVDLENGGAALMVGAARIKMSDVKTVEQ